MLDRRLCSFSGTHSATLLCCHCAVVSHAALILHIQGTSRNDTATAQKFYQSNVAAFTFMPCCPFPTSSSPLASKSWVWANQVLLGHLQLHSGGQLQQLDLQLLVRKQADSSQCDCLQICCHHAVCLESILRSFGRLLPPQGFSCISQSMRSILA